MKFLVEVVLAVLLCVVVTAQPPTVSAPISAAPAAPSVAFNAIQSGGNAQCLADTPVIRSSAVSASDCQSQCVSVLAGSCFAVNYRTDSSLCEMFSVASSNYTQASGCSLYQAQKPPVQCPSSNLCLSSPCQHGGTCSRTGVNNAYYSCACAPLFTGRNCETFFCDQHAADGCPSAAYTVPAGPGGSSKTLFCENSNGTTWLVFQRRFDGSVDFYQNWTTYEQGFGDPTLEFWMGNWYLATFSGYTTWKMRVDVTDGLGAFAYTDYASFTIGATATNYKLTYAGVTGNGTDGLNQHNNMAYSTFDSDHDLQSNNCAVVYHGAWWYNGCHSSNLNGRYNDTTFAVGPSWTPWRSYTQPMMKTKLKIRPSM